jgi:kinesin family protein C2/C3
VHIAAQAGAGFADVDVSAQAAALNNVDAFLRAAGELGVAPSALFSAADLEAEEPRPAVVTCLAALQAATSAAAPAEPRPATPPPLRRLLSSGSGGNWLSETPSGPREASLFSLGVSLLRDSSAPAPAPQTAEQRPLLAGLPEHMLTPVLEAALAEITREYERRLMRKEGELRKARDAAADAARHEEAALAALEEAHLAEAAATTAAASVAAESQEAGNGERSLRRISTRRATGGIAAAPAMAAVGELRSALRDVRADAAASLADMAHDLERLTALLPPLAARAARASTLAAENRSLAATVQELKGTIRVACRVRPLLPGEAGPPAVAALGARDDGAPPRDVAAIDPIAAAIAARAGQQPPPPKSFAFDRAFDANATQAALFEEVAPLVRGVLDGYEACVFAYGQTGAGKTHTMAGPASLSADPEMRGVSARALELLFEVAASRSAEWRYEVTVSMVEIYNETVRDLLAPAEEPRLEVRLSGGGGGSGVPDAWRERVRSAAEAAAVMARGEAVRATGATALNAHSSRSHAVLIVTVAAAPMNPSGGKDGPTASRATLHLVDLAGSERVGRSEAEGERLREAQHINKSLSALGDVMAALQQRGSSASTTHIPYRNSKLTALLAAPLAGGARCIMLVHASPAASDASESLSALRFASRVASVELGAPRRRADGLAEAAAAREEAARERATSAALRERCDALERQLAGRGSPEAAVQARPQSAPWQSPSKPPRAPSVPGRPAAAASARALFAQQAPAPPPLRAERSSPAVLARAGTPRLSGRPAPLRRGWV